MPSTADGSRPSVAHWRQQLRMEGTEHSESFGVVLYAAIAIWVRRSALKPLGITD